MIRYILGRWRCCDENKKIYKLFFRCREIDLEHIRAFDRILVFNFWTGGRYDAFGVLDRCDLAYLFGKGKCGGACSDDYILSFLRFDLLRVPLLRRDDDLSRYVASDVHVRADLMDPPSLSEKSSQGPPRRTKGSSLRFGFDGACYRFVLLYFALDKHGESDPQHDLRCDELFCGKHDVLQKSVLFSCLRDE